MSGFLGETGFLRATGVAEAMLGTAPAWVWDVAEGRILLSSAAGVLFFGEQDLAALMKRRFDLARPGMNQLARLARTLPGDGAARLSLLRFFVGLRDISMPCRCSLLPDAGANVVLVIATGGNASTLGLAERFDMLFADADVGLVLSGADGELRRNAAAGDRGAGDAGAGDGGDGAVSVDLALPEGKYTLRILPPRSEQSEQSEQSGQPDAAPDADATSLDAELFEPDTAVPESNTPEPFTPEPFTPEPAALSAAGSGTPNRVLPETRRFTFQLDPDGRFVEVGAGFAALVGPKAADVVGRTVAEIAESTGLGHGDDLTRALDSRDTWSDVRVDWPTDFGELAELKLSALPRFGEGRSFAGFRGFADLLSVTPLPETDAEAEPEADTDTGTEAEAPRTDTEGAGSDPARATGPVVEPAPEPPVAETGDSAPEPVTELPEPAADIAAETEESAAAVPATGESDPREPAAAPEAPRVFQLHSYRKGDPDDGGALNDSERNAFRAIAEALGARWAGQEEEDRPAESPAESRASSPEAAEPGTAPEQRDEETGNDDGSEPAAEASAPDRAETEPVEAEQAAASLVTEILDRVPLGVAILRDNTVLAANRTFLELFDYPDIDDFEIAGGIAAVLEGRGEDEEPGTAVTARRRDGTAIQVEARLGRTPWIDGPAMLMSVRSVEPAEEAPAEAPEPGTLTPSDLRAVLDTAFDGVFVLDADGTILSANAGGARLVEETPDGLAGRPFFDLVAEDDQAAVADLLRGLEDGGVPSVLEQGREIAMVRDGGTVPVELSLGPVGAGEEDGPRRFCAILRDLRDWKAAEADLVAARKRAEAASDQKSDFLAKMSHEIRTPLNGIIGFSEVILEERFGPLGNDRYREYMKDIRESGEHLMSLVNDLLDLSKVEAGKLEMSFTGVRLNDLVEQCVAVMQPQSSRARVIIRTSLGHSMPAVVADTRSIRQVLLNILSNAIKFTGPGGQVIVSTALGETGEVFLRVRDTGVGMSESDIVTALEPFRQLPVTPSTGERGTGLGLPLAKALVDANRANFSLQSKPGEGTLVEITFPQQRVLAE